MTLAAYDAVKILEHRVKNFKPRIALVLGSGLSNFVNCMEDPVVIPYMDLPGFHASSVEGHKGDLYLGKIHGVSVACLQGRLHYYEGATNHVFQTMVRTLKLLGCEIWLGTNASGSLSTDILPGSLMLVKDHINFQFNNVLMGVNDETFGSRFVSLENAYDPLLRKKFFELALKLDIPLKEGVYVGVLGPSFETPAEIKAYRILGADLVGMSTIPEVIAARHCGMRVAVISVVTNLAVGLSDVTVTHDVTLKTAKMAEEKLQKLLLAFFEKF